LDCSRPGWHRAAGILSVCSVEIGEPSESLFSRTADYAGHLPSNLDAVRSAKYGGKAFWGQDVQRMAERYFKQRKT
jgi:hypothetical protein